MANCDQYRTNAAENKKSFSDTPSHAERQLLRNLVRKAKDISLRESTALLFFLNHWFRHRGGEGVIHPGAQKLANAARCGLRTARSLMKTLREWGFIVPVKYEKGGRNATRYMVDTQKILTVLGNVPETVEGDLVAVKSASEGVDKPCKNHRGNKDRIELPKPAIGAEWLLRRFQAGLVVGLSRWIDPDLWRKRQEVQAKQVKSQSLAWEVPF